MSTPRFEIRSPVLQRRLEEYQRSGDRARVLAEDLTPAQFWWRPEAGRWSIAECLDHLVLADEAYLEVLDEAITSGRSREQYADSRPTLSPWGKLLVHGVEPPARLKIPAPRRIQPRRPMAAAQDLPPGDVESPLTRFLTLRVRLGRRLEQADGLDLQKPRVRSPFVPLLTVNLGTALRIVSGHERRHLVQGEAVRRTDGFPEVMRGRG